MRNEYWHGAFVPALLKWASWVGYQGLYQRGQGMVRCWGIFAHGVAVLRARVQLWKAFRLWPADTIMAAKQHYLANCAVNRQCPLAFAQYARVS
mmetsp:Transcript_8823/g.54304  ORF Transcript_8823/g.54304 Transcript_8823/m.54304 type:complete len:94 (+) Transcript_8823:3915-4196(+)